MYGPTGRAVQRPDDDQFYCVMLVEGITPGETAPGRGSFADMLTKAQGILRNKPYVTQVHINHKGNFWDRVTR
jgi:hypothetical protein